MLRVHVGLNLEHEAAEPVFIGAHLACAGGMSARCRCVCSEKIEQQLHAEVVDRRAEENRRLLAGKARKSVVEGKSVSVRVALGSRRRLTKNQEQRTEDAN